MSQVTRDLWHMTHRVGWTFSQNFISLALPVWDWHFLEDIWTKELLTHLFNQWMTKLFIEQPWLHTRDEQWLSRESQSQWSPCFLSLDTSLDIKTVISKVLIPVLISRLKTSESQFQSRYQDSNFKTLDSSLNIKTQLWKV